MAIYDIFEHVEKCVGQEDTNVSHTHASRRFSEMTLESEVTQEDPETKNRFFSSVAARLFFFMLLIADCVWGLYAIALFCVSLCLNLVTGFQLKVLRHFHARRYLNIKRVFVCAVSLIVALFSPALGTMFACTYFLMYDKKGIEEVVPAVLQDQFREFFNQ